MLYQKFYLCIAIVTIMNKNLITKPDGYWNSEYIFKTNKNFLMND